MNTQAMLAILENIKSSTLSNDELEAVEDVEYAIGLDSEVALRQHIAKWTDEFCPDCKYQEMTTNISLKFVKEGLL